MGVGASGPTGVWGLRPHALGHFSPVGKVPKSTLKKTEVFLRIFPHYFFSFALALWSVFSKPCRVPCMGFCGYPNMSPRTVKRWCRGALGALVVLVVDQLQVAPFHYATEEFLYTVWVGLRSAPFHYAQDRFPYTDPTSTVLSIA